MSGERNKKKEADAKERALELHIDQVIRSLKNERLISESELFDEERILEEHRNNQKRFEYDYEEDFYEPIYDDEE